MWPHRYVGSIAASPEDKSLQGVLCNLVISIIVVVLCVGHVSYSAFKLDRIVAD